MRLGLGTVQFGMPYGTANPQPEVPLVTVRDILSHAQSLGLNILDTAVNYGSSEEKLGQCDLAQWRVVSKLPEIPSNENTDFWMEAQVRASLERLKIPMLDGLLLHRPEQLLGARSAEILKSLTHLKEKGLVGKTGISVYAPDEIFACFDLAYFDLVQVPFNLLDRRILKSGCLDFLNDKGVEVHARSIFLQGLLLMDLESKNRQFGAWHSIWQELDIWVRNEGISYLEACIAFVKNTPGIDTILVGVNSTANLEEIVSVFESNAKAIPGHIHTDDPQLLNPANWSVRQE